jgi:hypothetical protein
LNTLCARRKKHPDFSGQKHRRDDQAACRNAACNKPSEGNVILP